MLTRLATYEPETVMVDGLEYREAMNAVGITGGIAGNVIPDRCVVTVNYRYAPDKSPEDALGVVHQLFSGYVVEVKDNAPGARPGLHLPAAKAFVEALGCRRRGQAGLDRRRAVLRDGRAGGQLRPGGPQPRPPRRGACPVSQLESAEAALLRWLA